MCLLTWTIDETDDAAVVRFSGEFDMSGRRTADEVVRTAERMGKPLLVLDLSALDFMDSSGLHLALDARERAVGDARRLALVAGAGRRLLEVAGVVDLFELLDEPPPGDGSARA
ncbi:MAG: STAS domain-containing protein [Actinomycetota bacterium]